MPQASEELRREWAGSDGISEDKAENYLKSKGYKLTPSWLWILPNPNHNPTIEEIRAISFLVNEWDYGGWVRDEEESKVYEIAKTDINIGGGTSW